MRWIYLTLLRYQRYNLPISSLDLQLGIDTDHYHVAQKLIKQAITCSQPSLKELRLAISALYFTVPDEVFSVENLNTLTLEQYDNINHHLLRISIHPHIIRCTNLRVLELSRVHITPSVFNELLSKNKLLEKIYLWSTPSLTEIKLNNLPFLREFMLSLANYGWLDTLEIHDTPSLRSIDFNVPPMPTFMWEAPPSIFEIRTVGSLTRLQLQNVHIDDAFSDMIKSSFPCLEELILEIKWSSVDILYITSLTLREFSLSFISDHDIEVQVSAPNLVTYTHGSSTVPIPLFTTTPPQQIHLSLVLTSVSIDHEFLLKMREALKLSSKFTIEMSSYGFEVSDLLNVDDMKTILPATNVGELILKEHIDSSWKNSLLLDAVFSICHPMYTKTNDELRLKVAKYFLKLILEGAMENCEIRNPLDGKWVALTSSSLSLLDTTTPDGFYEFKPSWCSP